MGPLIIIYKLSASLYKVEMSRGHDSIMKKDL